MSQLIAVTSKACLSGLIGLGLTLPAISAQAENLPGLGFGHHDWEITCDNTRTCRAAGYHSEADEMRVSVLLTRKAGPNQPVTAELMIGAYDDEAQRMLPANSKLKMEIDGRHLGYVTISKDNLVAKLSDKQTSALLAALTRTSSIEWISGEYRWRLSDKGAAAVLLKMDEFQGRIGTVGAIVKKGKRGEASVLPPLPPLALKAAPIPQPQPGEAAQFKAMSRPLKEAIRSILKEDDYCPRVQEEDNPLEIVRLNSNKLLVSTPCWSAAYNFGSGFWVVNDTPPYRPVLVTNSGSDYSDGHIGASHKGRGIGDCWSLEGWTWDGQTFVHSESSTTGMCRLMAAGGAWTLPRIVTEEGGQK